MGSGQSEIWEGFPNPVVGLLSAGSPRADRPSTNPCVGTANRLRSHRSNTGDAIGGDPVTLGLDIHRAGRNGLLASPKEVHITDCLWSPLHWRMCIHRLQSRDG